MERYRVVSGTSHHSQIKSNFAGYQYTAIAYFASVIVFLPSPIYSTWNSYDVGNMFQHGHDIYVGTNTIFATGDNTPRHLRHWELPIP